MRLLDVTLSLGLLGFTACSAGTPRSEAFADKGNGVTPEASRSVVTFEALGTVETAQPILQIFQEGRDGAPPEISLAYSVEYPDHLILDLDTPYQEIPYQEIQQAPGTRAVLRLSKGSQSLRSSSGEMFLARTDQGMRIELSEFNFVAVEGDSLDPEVFSEGSIEGPAGPLNNGVPESQYRRDDAWSSPFCAPYRSE